MFYRYAPFFLPYWLYLCSLVVLNQAGPTLRRSNRSIMVFKDQKDRLHHEQRCLFSSFCTALISEAAALKGSWNLVKWSASFCASPHLKTTWWLAQAGHHVWFYTSVIFICSSLYICEWIHTRVTLAIIYANSDRYNLQYWLLISHVCVLQLTMTCKCDESCLSQSFR